MRRFLISVISVCAFCLVLDAQTASSLFWRKDSLQVKEIVSELSDQYRKVGHHGPAVENSHMALRLYFNNSGAIDVYSKAARGMELLKYLWYPTASQQEQDGAGCDEYKVGSTVGLGGIALWDGTKEVKLVATEGRTARVGDTKKGSYAEMIAYGVEYMDGKVDVSIRIDVNAKRREAVVTASELNGRKVCFLTGVNYHKGQHVFSGEGYAGVWGVHPADVSASPIPIGAGIWFDEKDFTPVEKTGNMMRIISRPSSKIRTKIISASTKEAELNNARRFEAFMAK